MPKKNMMEYLSELETDLYSLISEDNDEVYERCQNFILELFNTLVEKFPDKMELTELQVERVNAFAKEYVLYELHQKTFDEQKTLNAVSRIAQMVAEQIDAPMQMNQKSLLMMLYYFVDIIASSSAMGRGEEESIIPCDDHILAAKSFFEYLKTPAAKKIQDIYHSCLRTKQELKEQVIVLPLLFDLLEVSYASLKGWVPEHKAQKNERIDSFYQEKAEKCMAKGSLRLLDMLMSMPDEFKKALNSLSIPLAVLNPLARSSAESIAQIKAQVSNRRYRGGNSAKTWLATRGTVTNAPKPPTEGAARGYYCSYFTDKENVKTSPLDGAFPLKSGNIFGVFNVL